MSNMADGLNMQPRIGEPETSIAGAQPLAGGPQAFSGPNIPDTSGPGPTALQQAPAWTYDFDPGTGSARATFNGEVVATTISTPAAGVASFNTRTGAVVLTAADITGAGGLANPSPTFAGTPNTPTAAPGTNSTQVASCQFVQAAINANAGVATFNGRAGAVTLTSGDVVGAGGAPTVSPAFTGVPTAPTATQGDVSSQIATDAFVSNAIAGGTVTTFNGRRGAVALTLSDVMSVGGAPIASPTFTGLPAVPTAAPGTATTQAASTAFVTNAVSGAVVGVSSFNTRTGPVVFTASDLASVGGAPLASPAFIGTPTAPTPTAGDSSTRLATTAYVETAIGSLPSGVSTFNGRTGTVVLTLADVTSVGGAPLASPTFTGSPLTTTPVPGDNSTRIADTAFVAAAIGALPAQPAPSGAAPLINGTATPGTSALYSRGDHVHPTDTTRAAQASLASYAPLAGASFTGGISATSGTITGNLSASTFNTTGQINIGAGVTLDADSGIQLTGSFGTAALYVVSGGAMTLANTLFPANLQLDAGTNFLFNGSGTAIKAGGGPWTAPSDDRIKTVLGDYDRGLDEVKALRPVSFVYKGNDTPTGDLGGTNADPAPYAGAAPFPASPHYRLALEEREFIGFIAQELEPVFPGMVTSSPGFIDGEAVADLRQVNVGELVYALVNAVKTLAARVEALESA